MRNSVVAQALLYVLAGPCMYTATRSRVNRSYSRAVRALVDIQDILYPSGHRPRRPGRMPNGYPKFRLWNVELPSSPDSSDSDETAPQDVAPLIGGTGDPSLEAQRVGQKELASLAVLATPHRAQDETVIIGRNNNGHRTVYGNVDDHRVRHSR